MALLPGQSARKLKPIQQGLAHARIGGKPVTYKDWASGGFLRALTGQKKPAAPKPKPKPGAAPVTAVAPTAAPVVRPPPVDPIYEQGLGSRDVLRTNRVADIRSARTQGLIDYGFTETGFDYGRDAAGNPVASGTLAIDPNNPFGKAAELKRRYDTSRRATGQGMGAGGQLYAGAYQNAQDSLNRQQLGAEDTLNKSLAAFLLGNVGKYHGEQTDYANDVNQLGAERMGRIAENPLYDPTIGGAETKQIKTATKKAAAPKLTPKQTAAKQAADAARKRAEQAAREAEARAKARKKKK